MLSGEGDFVAVQITDLSSPSAGVGEWAGSHAGTRSGSILPVGVCVVLNKEIARRYRGGKPRQYLPYGTDSDLSGASRFTSAFTSDLVTAWDGFQGTLSGTAVGPATITNEVNVSYYDGFTVVTNPSTGRARNKPTLRATPLVDSVLEYSASEVPGSQRRRNRA
jgi:hypothetical protein